MPADTVEVFDPEFKFMKEVPLALIAHLPPMKLKITRLVFCRNYLPHDLASCNMGNNCRFVHVDVPLENLDAHPVHVNYAWKGESLCTYPRLPSGEVLHVLDSDGINFHDVNSELVLVTCGSLRYDKEGATFSHCFHYNQNGMCKRGDRCNFVHVVNIDPTVSRNFKRVTPNVKKSRTVAATTKISSGSDENNLTHDDEPPRCRGESDTRDGGAISRGCPIRFRFNPYAPGNIRVMIA